MIPFERFSEQLGTCRDCYITLYYCSNSELLDVTNKLTKRNGAYGMELNRGCDG